VFDRLFKDPHAVARQRNGPLAEERLRYLTHCAEQQMAPMTLLDIATYLLVVAKALRLAERPVDLITRDEVKAAADRWTSRHCSGSRSSTATGRVPRASRRRIG
jgi:hypothetical protein